MASNPRISLDSAVETVITAMKNSMKADVCASRLCFAAGRIDQELEKCTSTDGRVKIVKFYPELLRAGINFLTFNQSPQDHAVMLNRLMDCRCDLTQTRMRRLHNSRSRINGRSLPPNIDLVFDAVATVSNCIILALADLTQHRFRTGNANNGDQLWPQGPEDLLPHGPKDSVAGLELWASMTVATSGYIIFKLAGCLASFYVPFAQEIFLSNFPHFNFALVRPFHHLDKAVKLYELGDVPTSARIKFFDLPVTTIFEYFDVLWRCDTVQCNQMVTARAWMLPILEGLMRVLVTIPRTTQWSEIRSFVHYLTVYAKADINPVTGVGVVCFKRDDMTEIDHQDPIEDAFNTMAQARKIGCWNIPCSSAREVIHSRLCTKCNLIRYCGEPCQKEAWRCTTLPHKSLCAKVHSLRELLGPDNWSLMWTLDFTYAQFQAMCRAKKVETKVLEEIRITLDQLRLGKSKYREEAQRAGASQIERLILAEQKKLALQKAEAYIADLSNASDLLEISALD